MALRMFVHALRMVFGDLVAVLKVSSPVILVIIVGVILLGGQMGDMMTYDFDPAEQQMPDMAAGGLFLVFLLAYVVASLWMAVAWHRYCLLAEYPGTVLPTFHGGEVLGYFGRGLLLFLVALLAVVAGSFLVGGLAVISEALGAVVGLFGMLYLFWALYRLSIILPAAAVGRRLSFGEAWAATKPYGLTIIGVFLLLLLFLIAVGIVVGLLALLSPILGTFLNLVMTWLQTVISLSILTTIYGVAVEGREIE